MRLFYAVNFAPELRDTLQSLQDELRINVHHGRWADLENLHITLHFVGEAEESELSMFKEALDIAAEGIKPFNIRFTSYGSFRQGKQDLIYIKTKNSGDSLSLLADGLKNKLKRGDMKSFVPHITMVRRAEIKYQTLKLLKKQRFDLPPVMVKTVELMESKKINGKLSYIPIYSLKLTEN
ncbi:MAG: RNA 2',3'-cyclic phosphodiesterase [Spirochaetales bacterium]|nr:RNA 2',3'-cyclic phosphodiesterase [Spirochaetales bacterium]